MAPSQLSQATSLSFRHLQTFLIVAEEMSFSQAAERLGIAQPPLSRQVQRLESQLNVKLFERTRPQIRLTAAGQIFAKTAKTILQQMESSMAAVKLVERGLVGQLSIGIDSASPACDLAVKLMSLYQKQQVDIEFKLHELSSLQQLKALRLGQIDIGFQLPQTLPTDIKAQTLVREPLVIALPSDHVLATQSRLTLVDLDEIPLVIDSRLTNVLIADMHYTHLRSQITQTISDSRLLMSVVASGAALSIIPASIEHSQPHSDVVFLPIVPSIEVISLTAVWNQHPSSTIAPLIDFLGTLSSKI